MKAGWAYLVAVCSALAAGCDDAPLAPPHDPTPDAAVSVDAPLADHDDAPPDAMVSVDASLADRDDPRPDASTACATPAGRALRLPADRVSSMLTADDPAGDFACVPGLLPLRVYPLHLDAMTLVDLKLDVPGTLALRPRCGEVGAEIGCSAGTLNDARPSFHRVLEAGDYDVRVGAHTADVLLPYELTLTAVDPPLGRSCASPLPLAPESSPVDLRVEEGSAEPAACLPSGAFVRFLSVTIPPRQRAIVSGSANGDHGSIALSVLDRCGAKDCVGSGSSFRSNDETHDALLSVPNPGAAARTVVLAMTAHNLSGIPATGTVSVGFVPELPAARNARCDTATPVVDGTTLVGENLGAALASYDCRSPTLGAGEVLYYRATVPPNGVLVAEAVTAVAEHPTLVTLPLDDCAVAVCPSYYRSNEPRTVPFRSQNPGTTAAEVTFGVSALRAGEGGVFDLRVSIRSAPANGVCANAMLVRSGDILRDQDSTHAIASPEGLGCGAGVASLFYAVDVPAGATLVATPVTRTGDYVRVNVMADCGDASCLAYQRGEATTYTNPDPVTRRVILTTTTGHFDLAVTVTPPAP